MVCMQSTPRTRLRAAGLVLTATAGAVAVLVIVGELFENLPSPLPGNWCDMSVISAVAVMLLGCSILCGEFQARVTRACGMIAAGLVLIMSAASLLGHLGTANPEAAQACSAAPDYRLDSMSDPVALWCGMFAVLLLISRSRSTMRDRTSTVLAVVLLLGAYVIVFAQVFAAPSLTTIGKSPTSAYVTICVALLLTGWALLQVASGRWPAVTERTIAGSLLRQSLPFLLLVPVVVATLADRTVSWTGLSSAGVLTIAATLTSVILFILMLRVVAAVGRVEDELRERAHADAMTGLANSWSFGLLAGQLLSQARRLGAQVSVIFMDLDGLKAINDTHGHDAGSRAIADFAQVLSATARDGDLAARVGGDEFVLLVIADAGTAAGILARVRESIRALNAEREIPIRFSAGVASADPDLPIDSLVRAADLRMYEEKERHRREGGSKITGIEARDHLQGE